MENGRGLSPSQADSGRRAALIMVASFVLVVGMLGLTQNIRRTAVWVLRLMFGKIERQTLPPQSATPMRQIGCDSSTSAGSRNGWPRSQKFLSSIHCRPARSNSCSTAFRRRSHANTRSFLWPSIAKR